MTTNTAFYLDMNEGLEEGESNKIFVGRAGSFCPIKSGCGGGVLLRAEKDGRYSSATGTKGFRWKESEVVKGTPDEEDVDVSYFDQLVDEAVASIEKYGDIHWFIDDLKDIPWVMPCGDSLMEGCSSCPHFKKDYDLCDLGFDISDILLKLQ